MNKAEAADKVMALVVRLHLDNMQPWPPRKRVAELTGVPLPMLDTVMSRLVGTGQIIVWVRTTESNTGASTIIQKFIEPSQDALKAY